MGQDEAAQALQRFRSCEAHILVSTDRFTCPEQPGGAVAQGCTISFDLPLRRDVYLRRVGQSGHWGRRVWTVSLVAPWEMDAVRDLERCFQTQIQEFDGMPL
eukprot:TRINITY_DN19488_c0_g1_i1.p4 TRINITY_DN19488_c0_g1~~TRINITY_DN19488_c0_g1_i1.p4  ORF type:complete len:102 (-),score=16.54 TRINITY_DN19488_c0_g1_i1:294-599(-)